MVVVGAVVVDIDGAVVVDVVVVIVVASDCCWCF